MWLINAKTLELEEFPFSVRPSYAILSHRWDVEEVSFRDMHNIDRRQSMKGFQKILRCCQQALEDGLQYAWVDTCSINKESSAELTEAINSMYQWYHDAEVCYAYLYDVGPPPLKPLPQSDWFGRGWTLQELIAPKTVLFFASSWDWIGDRQGLRHEISEITHIDVSMLDGSKGVEEFSIAKRMSWASNREITRPEDRAYSLLGIFQVNMPMIYGEGDRAFRRLQEQIIKDSDDHSIFAWPLSMEPDNHGMLASSPAAFADSKDIESISVRRGRSPYSLTNRGVSITLNLTPWCLDTYIAILNCAPRYSFPQRRTDLGGVGIYLRKLLEDDSYARIELNGEEMVYDIQQKLGSTTQSSIARDVSINIRQIKLSAHELDFIGERLYGFRLSERLLGQDGSGQDRFTIMTGPGATTWRRADRLLIKANGARNFTDFGTIDVSQQHKKIKLIRVGFDYDFNPYIFLAESSATDENVKIWNKSGQLNLGDRSARQWTDKEYEEFKAFGRRSLEDEWGWNTIVEARGQTRARINTFRDGLWMLRGDRVDGLDIILEGLGGEKSPEAHLTIQRADTLYGKVWEVDLADVATSSFGKMRTMFGRS